MNIYEKSEFQKKIVEKIFEVLAEIAKDGNGAGNYVKFSTSLYNFIGENSIISGVKILEDPLLKRNIFIVGRSLDKNEIKIEWNQYF